MTKAFSPERWAIDISLLLNAVLGQDRFPVDVPSLAREYTAQKYPDDSISLVIGRSLSGFDGALYRAPEGKKGWASSTTAPSLQPAASTSRSGTSSVIT